MDHSTVGLRAGDWVEVLSPEQVQATLDGDGTLAGLPFMPEMARLCGRRFRVARRVEKTCHDVHQGGAREFRGNDVVQLADVRCTGAQHGDCNRQCVIFWKEAWLCRVAGEAAESLADTDVGQSCSGQSCSGHSPPIDALCQQLITIDLQGRYICQSSQLAQASALLSTPQRLRKVVREVQVGNRSVWQAVGVLLWTTYWKGRAKCWGKRPAGPCQQTPQESLHLQPGEWVEVKSFEEIRATLNARGLNRGLSFEADMRPHCGKRFRVHSRLDKMVLEENGELYQTRNTVILEGINCGCYFSWGGCGRGERMYWREIWLKRVEGQAAAAEVR